MSAHIAMPGFYPMPDQAIRNIAKERMMDPSFAEYVTVRDARDPTMARDFADQHSTWTVEQEMNYFASVVAPFAASRKIPVWFDPGHTNIHFMFGAAKAMVENREQMKALGIDHVSFLRIRRSR